MAGRRVGETLEANELILRRVEEVLKAGGRMQVSAVVAWQATALTALAVVIGLPLGVIIGRWAWALFAGAVAISEATKVPWLWVGLAAPIAVLVANIIAFGPGWVGGRLKPATILRSEWSRRVPNRRPRPFSASSAPADNTNSSDDQPT